MPITNSVLQYWDHQQKVFVESLALLRQKPGKIATHELRVTIKKTRSYLKLRQELTGEVWREEFGQTKSLYLTIGRFRDTGMGQLLLLKSQRNENIFVPSFKKHLGGLCGITKRWLKQSARDYNGEKMETLFTEVHASFSAIPDEEMERKMYDLIKNVFKKVRSLARHFRKNAHTIRKLLKDVYYWLKAWNPNPFFNVTGMKRFKRALDELGFWQDRLEFENRLMHFRKEWLVKGTEEYVAARKLETLIAKNRKVLLSEAEKKIKQLIMKKKEQFHKPKLAGKTVKRELVLSEAEQQS
jgi:CHAD domain-containing protein